MALIPKKLTLIALFTSDIPRWYCLRYLNVHDGKMHRLAPAHRVANVILFGHALLRPVDRDPLLAGESIHPTVVVAGALSQNILGGHTGLMDIAKEMYGVLRSTQQRQVHQNDDVNPDLPLTLPAA